MDLIDKKILSLLQRDASLPLTTIAKKVGLSTTQCFNRIKKLEEDGVIKKKVAIIDNRKIDLPVIVYLSINVAKHTKEWLDTFTNQVTSFDEVVEMYRINGDTDYLIKVVVQSIEAYDNFSQRLISEINFRSLKSNIVLKENLENVKNLTGDR